MEKTLELWDWAQSKQFVAIQGEKNGKSSALTKGMMTEKKYTWVMLKKHNGQVWITDSITKHTG